MKLQWQVAALGAGRPSYAELVEALLTMVSDATVQDLAEQLGKRAP